MARSDRGETLDGKMVGLILGVVCLIVAALAITALMQQVTEGQDRRSRVPVTANLLEVTVEAATEGADPMASVIHAHYSYEYVGRQLESKRVWLHSPVHQETEGNEALAEGFRARNKAGTLQAWVRPEAPTNAVLINEAAWGSMRMESPPPVPWSPRHDALPLCPTPFGTARAARAPDGPPQRWQRNTSPANTRFSRSAYGS